VTTILTLGGAILLAGAVRDCAALATAGLAVMLWTLLWTALRWGW